MNRMVPILAIALGAAFAAVAVSDKRGLAGDAASRAASQWGESSARNNASSATGLPTQWDPGTFDPRTDDWIGEGARSVKWVARLGHQTYGTPIVAGGKVFCATSNGGGYVTRYGRDTDLGCLLAFRAADGGFLWQLSREKLAAGRSIDWPEQGICCSPLVEGDRLWIVTNRGEVACLDTEGFADGENDGPYKDEPSTDRGEADIVWLFNMMKEVGSVQHNMASCSVTARGELLFVNTSNGVDESHENIPAPEAPSFLALEKDSGKLVWADSSPGKNIMHGQWGSPAVAELGGVPQVLFPGGDGWLYSFLATRENQGGRPKLLWKFDCNPKAATWQNDGRGDRNEIIATPVVWEGRVYLATGQDPEYGEGQGHLWCIDPTKRGDVSAEIVLDRQGRPVPHRRIQAVDVEAGEQAKPNPNSAALWHYTGHDANADGEMEFEETFHRSIGLVAVQDGILVTGDFAGLIHCLDGKTGKVHWTHDMLASIWGSPLVADGKIYLGDEDGDVAVFALSADKKLLAENMMNGSIYSAPVAVGKVLYISTRSHLFAIGE